MIWPPALPDGELSPLAGDLGIRAQRQLIGGDEFDDTVLVAHGIGLNGAVLIYRLRVKPNGAAVINELATGTDHNAVSRRQVDGPLRQLNGPDSRLAASAIKVNVPATRLDRVIGEIVSRFQRRRPIVRIRDFGAIAKDDVASGFQRQLATGHTVRNSPRWFRSGPTMCRR